MIGMSGNRRADEMYGYRSETLAWRIDNFPYPYIFRSEFTHVVAEWGYSPALRWLIVFLFVLREYDIWVAFFDGRLLKDTPLEQYEGALLKLAGVKIVALPYGSDVQVFDGHKTRFDWLERLWDDYSSLYEDKLLHNAKVRQRIEFFTKYADLIVGFHFCDPFMPRVDLHFGYFPVDTDACEPLYETGNEVPVIVHAPNHRRVKGTDIIIDACERLRSEDVPIELKLIEGVSHDKVFDIYRKADIFAEQFCIGDYGLTALEALALGKPVLTYMDESVLDDPVYNLPIVNTNRENMQEVIRALIYVPELRARLGRAGREAVERYRSIRAIGEVWDRVYKHLWFDEPLALETTAVFDPSRQPRSRCENPREIEFWPVDVRDLIVDIRSACQPAARHKGTYER